MRHSLHTAQYCTAAGLLTLRRVKIDQIKIKTVLGVNHHHLPILTAMKSSGFIVKKIALIQLLNSRFCSHFVKSCDLSANNAKVKDYAKVILNQKIEVLNLISCEDYSRRVLSSSTIGAHMRHSLDHFNAVLNANAGNTVLDYDSRERNTDIESVRLSALRNCENLLQKIHESTFDDPVTVKFTSNPTTGSSFLLPSSIYRELAFVSHHAVHHLSSIKSIMNTLGYDLKNGSIGVASSTQLFESTRRG